MKAKEEEPAQIISIQSLMAGEIGDAEEKVEPFNGKVTTPKVDILGITSTEEEEEEKTPPPVGKPAGAPLEKEEEEEEKTTPTPESTTYVKSLKSLFGDSITHVLQENGQGEEVEVALEDLEISQEMYEDIVKARMAEMQEEAKQNTISTEGISEFVKELIEIDRLGGDVGTLLQSKETYTDVLDKLDLSKKEDQRKAVYLRYKAAGTYADDEITTLIQGYEAKGTLAETSEKAEKEIRGAVNQQVEAAKKAALKQKEDTENLLKEYKKDFKEKLGAQFELEDGIKTKIVNLATKRDDKGRFEIDAMYFKLKNDPEQAARLALFILDRAEYDKQVSKEVKKETQLGRAKSISLLKKGTSSVDDLKRGTKKDSEVINLKALNN